MCGFFGEFVWSNGKLLNGETFSSLLSLSEKRGPDHSAIWASERIQLGFNRLAIQDLSPNGNQPMVDENSGSALVFNGEIYNHSDIRIELSVRGIQFKGHSDTETILKSILHFGFEPTVARLDGMFALAFYDNVKKSLHLARDFAGIKPLFVGLHRNGIVFSSQYDQLCSHPEIKINPIDPGALRLYLQQHFMPAPFALLANTFQLEPGEIISISASGHLSHKRYWVFPDTWEESISDPKEAIELLVTELFQSVKAEMLSDVPLGSFLSGGIDSPLVTSFAREINPDIQTFSIGSDSEKHDESADAQDYARQMGVKNIVYRMDGVKALEWWEKAMKAMHEPIADYSILPTYVVSALARKDVTVALSGDGGDELFYGYDRFRSIAKNVRFQRWPYPFKAGLYAADKYLAGQKYFNSGILGKSQAKNQENLHSRIDQTLISDIEQRMEGFHIPENYSTYSYPTTSDKKKLLHAIRKAEFYGMMQKTLRKVDLASMENSLEIRVPFLKKTVIEQSLKINYLLSYEEETGGGKKILKELLDKRLPSGIHKGPKRGFTIPLNSWSRNELKETFGDMLHSSHITDLVGKDSISKLWDSHYSGKKNQTWSLFTLYSLSSWMNQLEK